MIKLIQLEGSRVLLQFVNVTDSIAKQNIKLQNESLTVLNAYVSHELRNPLNSIQAQNTEFEGLLEQLSDVVTQSTSFEITSTVKRKMV